MARPRDPDGPPAPGAMLTLSNTTLPHTVLGYVAFRVAFLETLSAIAVHDRTGGDPHDRFGFLCEVPFLRCVPAHVQLDLLAATWSRHAAHDHHEADVLDEAVLYAACESAGRLCGDDPEATADLLAGGPVDVTLGVDGLLADELRSLHLTLAGEGDFLTISQFEDDPPQEARELKARFGIDPDRLDPLFDALSRWNLSEDFLGNLSGLLTGPEILDSVRVLGVK